MFCFHVKKKGKPCNSEANVCGSLYSTFKSSFFNAFYNKRLQTLFKDQLDRSKATCSFNFKQILDTPLPNPGNNLVYIFLQSSTAVRKINYTRYTGS